eukprot:scaffold27355_cov135-Isochrysis_galbana.AAC.1
MEKTADATLSPARIGPSAHRPSNTSPSPERRGWGHGCRGRTLSSPCLAPESKTTRKEGKSGRRNARSNPPSSELAAKLLELVNRIRKISIVQSRPVSVGHGSARHSRDVRDRARRRFAGSSLFGLFNSCSTFDSTGTGRGPSSLFPPS